MADLEDFLNKKGKSFVPDGDKVEGTFMCMDCSSVTQKAFLNYEQKALLWICDSCQYFNRVSMNV